MHIFLWINDKKKEREENTTCTLKSIYWYVNNFECPADCQQYIQYWATETIPNIASQVLLLLPSRRFVKNAWPIFAYSSTYNIISYMLNVHVECFARSGAHAVSPYPNILLLLCGTQHQTYFIIKIIIGYPDSSEHVVLRFSFFFFAFVFLVLLNFILIQHRPISICAISAESSKNISRLQCRLDDGV